MNKEENLDHLSYEEAILELQSIAEEIEEEEISIDALEGKVKRSLALIRYCKERLRGTEKAIRDIFEEE